MFCFGSGWRGIIEGVRSRKNEARALPLGAGSGVSEQAVTENGALGRSMKRGVRADRRSCRGGTAGPRQHEDGHPAGARPVAPGSDAPRVAFSLVSDTRF